MCFTISHGKRLGETLKLRGLSSVSGASRSRSASRKLQRLVSVSSRTKFWTSWSGLVHINAAPSIIYLTFSHRWHTSPTDGDRTPNKPPTSQPPSHKKLTISKTCLVQQLFHGYNWCDIVSLSIFRRSISRRRCKSQLSSTANDMYTAFEHLQVQLLQLHTCTVNCSPYLAVITTPHAHSQQRLMKPRDCFALPRHDISGGSRT